MILIAGGTGRLGRELLQVMRDRPVRVLTRDPARAEKLGVEVAIGDVRDRASVDRAMRGVRCVVSAVHGFVGKGVSPQSVDVRGNANLIESAEAAGAERFVLLSVHGASAGHPMDLFRAKHAAEERLRASSLLWTIVRPTAFLETWLEIVGTPLLQRGSTVLFGRGHNPINFVSTMDVARLVALGVDDPAYIGQVVSLCGPENLSFGELVERIASIAGVSGRARHVPVPVMRASAWLMRPFRPSLARQIHAGVVMDTVDMTCNEAPPFVMTSVDEAIQRSLR